MSNTDEVLTQTDERMDASIVDAKKKFATLRTGRASINILDGIVIDYYGTPTPLNQVAKLSAPEPTMILAQPFDPSILPLMEKAIRASGLGLNPSNDGKMVRIPIPSLTEERRKEMVKRVRALSEDAKTSIRKIRRDANDEIKRLEKEGEISEDELHGSQDQVQKKTDKHTADIDALTKSKEQELMEI